jgi:DNA-binding SARP family transcriptional activator
LLTPSVEVIVDGQPRRLAPNVARLLVALAALGRAVGTEELGDLLWGDVDSVRARGRLKSALHRLRQALSLDIDELVVRDGDVVRLVADPRWAIDLHDFHRFAVGDVEQRLRAFRMVDGLLCNAQFPYDDALAQERAVLEARWSALAAGLVASGAIEQHEVRRRSQRLGIVQ